MSLTDLKKSASRGKKDNRKVSNDKSFTVDDFIEDADNYAKGVPQIVSSEVQSQVSISELDLSQALDLVEQQQK